MPQSDAVTQPWHTYCVGFKCPGAATEAASSWSSLPLLCTLKTHSFTLQLLPSPTKFIPYTTTLCWLLFLYCLNVLHFILLCSPSCILCCNVCSMFYVAPWSLVKCCLISLSTVYIVEMTIKPTWLESRTAQKDPFYKVWSLLGNMFIICEYSHLVVVKQFI